MNLNQELKSIFYQEPELSQRQLDDIYSDEYDAGYDDAYNLEACVPVSDLKVGREAYLEGYGVGMEAWNQIEYPDIHKRSQQQIISKPIG